MKLVDLVAEELAQPVDPRVTALAAEVAARHTSARAVLFYGSCLRQTALEEDALLDFYLIVADYAQAFGKAWLALANRLLPPNVFPIEADGLAAKYAVLSEADLSRLASAKTRNVSVWARFAQPSRLVWAADEEARREVFASIAQAAPALLAAARPRLPDRLPLLDMWRQAFAQTYRAELRAERRGRATTLVEPFADRYRRFSGPALEVAGLGATISHDFLTFDRPIPSAERARAKRAWARRRREGKALTILRLAKASATWGTGGIDYLAWKIGRHAGQPVELRPWQRRWPLLGAFALLPKLIARGAVR